MYTLKNKIRRPGLRSHLHRGKLFEQVNKGRGRRHKKGRGRRRK
jgi:hypothetical protein